MLRLGVVAGLALLGATLGAIGAPAAVLYSTGFENPPFVPGAISGQAGWSAFGLTSAPVVESSFVESGTQAVAIPGAVTSQTGPFLAPGFVDPVLDMSVDMYLFSSSTETGWQFGTTGAGGIGFAGGIDIGSTTSPHEGGTTIYAITGDYTTTLGTFTRNAWHRVDILLDYATQTYGVALDGTTIGSNLAFCGNNFGDCNGAAVTSMGWAFFDSFGDSSGAGDDLGVFDNFSIASVPEPTSLTLLAPGLLAFGLVRRRRA